MSPVCYVYIIDSLSMSDRYYIGFTRDIEDRLQHHNSGAVPSTAPYRPWTYRIYMAFSEKDKALDFERYLKSHSGRAFISKHF